MNDDLYLDDRRDPLAESGTRAARFAGGVDNHEAAALEARSSGREVGGIIANRYALQAHLGGGRYGEVYAAVDRRLSDSALGLEHRVALHFLDRRTSEQTLLLRKIESCYQQPHLWAHPNVVKIGGFGCDGGRYFLVMELLEGMTLRALLDTSSEVMSHAEIFAVLRGVGDALKYAHARAAIHGDIRPETIFITTDSAIKVLDLLPASSPRTRPFFVEDAEHGLMATPDARDDVYGLACVAYELFTGRHPFDGRSPLEASHAQLSPLPIPRLSTTQWDAVVRGLALSREHRIADVAQFLVELGVTGEALAAARQARVLAGKVQAAWRAPAPRADDDLPILGDHSGDWDVGALRARPLPAKLVQAIRRVSVAPRVHPDDVRRHAELTRLRERRGIGLGFASVLLVAALLALVPG